MTKRLSVALTAFALCAEMAWAQDAQTVFQAATKTMGDVKSNTHHHFDHSGGIRTYVVEGATIITNEINRPFYEQTFNAPRTLKPDQLSQNPKKPTFITVKDKYVLDDGGRSLEIYHVEGDNHNAGLMMVHLPKEKILVEADDFTPATSTTPPPTGPRAHNFTANLYQNIQRLKLDVNTIAPLHGIVVPFSELQKAAAD